MKKVLVLAAAALLFAAPAMGAISGTAHDLSAYSGTGAELCVFCHTPHGADTTVTKAPLWNRGTSTVDATMYVGLDIQATYDQTSVNQTDAPLCLSCHDGASLTTVLNNEPNSGTVNYAGLSLGADANLGTDMSNDHPIGFDFSAINALDSEIDTQANAEAEGAKFFGAGDNEMWCSSCHDVHDNTNAPFLNADNSGSALCLACHIK